MSGNKEKKKIVNIVEKDVDLKKQVTIYCDMMQRIDMEKKMTPVIRFAYENYYGMNLAGISPTWKNSYFALANKYLNDLSEVKPSFRELMDKIGVCDEKSIQPSFVSKLLHVLNKNEPIYDRNVRVFLETGEPNGISIEERKKSAIKLYEEKIKSFYNMENYCDLKDMIIDVFNENYSLNECTFNISVTKKIDFIIWALGKKGVKLSELILK